MKNVVLILTTTILMSCNSKGDAMNPAIAFLLLNTQPPSNSGICTTPRGQGDIRQAPDEIFMTAGQSNSIGINNVDQVYALQNAVIWIKDHWETYIATQCVGPEYGFAKAWLADNNGKTLGIVMTGESSTSILQWVNYLQDQSIIKTKSSFIKPPIAVLWVQGESDSMNAELAANFQSRLISVYNKYTQTFNNVKFIEAKTRWPATYIKEIQDGEAYIPTIGALEVDTDDLTFDASYAYHFDSKSQVILGDRMYQAYK